MASHLGMFGGGSPSEYTFADQAPADVLTDDEECCRAVEFGPTQDRLFS